MKDFSEAIEAQSVPLIFDSQVIRTGDIAEKADILLSHKKWRKVYMLLDNAEREY